METDNYSDLVKISFTLNPDDWHGSATETLWAKPLGGDRYELRNVPFYAFGVSYEDIVEASLIEGILQFVRVVSSGGHSTYRLLINGERSNEVDAFWAPLAAHGCTYEAGHPPLRAVDVPSSVNVRAVYSLLEKGEAAGVWSFEEGHVGHR